jgi:hypothetical protein
MEAAHSPEAKAKRAATLARKKAERDAAKLAQPNIRESMRKVQSIPLDMIPGDPPKKVKRKSYYSKMHPAVMTKEKAVFEIIRLATWLAQN